MNENEDRLIALVETYDLRSDHYGHSYNTLAILAGLCGEAALRYASGEDDFQSSFHDKEWDAVVLQNDGLANALTGGATRLIAVATNGSLMSEWVGPLLAERYPLDQGPDLKEIMDGYPLAAALRPQYVPYALSRGQCPEMDPRVSNAALRQDIDDLLPPCPSEGEPNGVRLGLCSRALAHYILKNKEHIPDVHALDIAATTFLAMALRFPLPSPRRQVRASGPTAPVTSLKNH